MNNFIKILTIGVVLIGLMSSIYFFYVSPILKLQNIVSEQKETIDNTISMAKEKQVEIKLFEQKWKNNLKDITIKGGRTDDIKQEAINWSIGNHIIHR